MVNHLVTIGCPEIADMAQRALHTLELPALSVQKGLFEYLFAYVKPHQGGVHA